MLEELSGSDSIWGGNGQATPWPGTILQTETLPIHSPPKRCLIRQVPPALCAWLRIPASTIPCVFPSELLSSNLSSIPWLPRHVPNVVHVWNTRCHWPNLSVRPKRSKRNQELWRHLQINPHLLSQGSGHELLRWEGLQARVVNGVSFNCWWR